MKLLKLFLATALLAAALGCRSRVVRVELVNTSPQPLHTIVVDYPGATFGVNQLAPGKTYQYTIKPQETGALKIQFTDAAGANHSYVGVVLHPNQEGSIEIRLDQNRAIVSPRMNAP